MSEAKAPLIGDALAAQALCEMAQRRGLHAALREAQQAWQDVHGESAEKRLSAAWQWLFAGHTVERVPVPLAFDAQMPAWVIADGAVGIVSRLRGNDEAMKIEWLGVAPERAPEVTELWVPISPSLAAGDKLSHAPRRGPATEAIVAALKAHKPALLNVGAATVAINLIAIVSSLFAMQVYDRVVPNFAYSTLWVLASGVLIAYLFDLFFKGLRVKMLEAVTMRLDEALSLYFFEKVMALKSDRRPSRVGSLVAQVRDYEAIKGFFTSSTLFVLADLPFIFLFIALIALIGKSVAWVLVLFVPLCLLIGLVVYKPMARLQREQNDEIIRRQGVLFEAVSGVDIIKSQGGEPNFSDVWLRSTRETAKRSEKLQMLTAHAQNVTSFFQQIAYVSILIVGVYEIERGVLTMGGMIACAILSSRALGTTSMITQLLLRWHHASYALQVLNELLSCPSDDDPGRQANAHGVPLDLVVQDLKYGYEGAQSAQLAVPKLEIKAGERIAILGRNGGGKSTLLKALAGLGTPAEGEVRLAGLDLQHCRPSWLRRVIGYLPQDVRLFSGTLQENLTLGLPLPDEAEIHAALEKTGLIDAVKRHPLGLGLPIREGGYGLSGGQRQLVGLTRLVLQDPDIWLLDEPSSSLDSNAEERVIRLFQEMSREKTLIFTAHRPSWLPLADRVLILEDGVIKVDTPADRVRAVQAKTANAAAANTGPVITTGTA